MDPLSIVTAAASLAGAVLKASFKIKETIDAYDDAPQSIADVADEVHAVQIALRQVESVVSQDPNAIERLGLEDVFTVAVNGCHATLLSISKEYENLFLRSDWKAKIQALWKEGEMTRLLGRLDRKKATLTLLTQTLNLRSTQDIKALLIRNQSTLNAAEQDVKEPAAYYPGFRPTSPDSLDEGSVVGVPRNRDSVLSITEFDFDHDLINTKTYRRALQRYAVANKHGDSSSGQGAESVPACIENLNTLLEEEDEAGDLIEFPTSPLTLQPPSSQATTICPDLEGIEFDVPPTMPSKDTIAPPLERFGLDRSKTDAAKSTSNMPEEAKTRRRFPPITKDKGSPQHLMAGLVAEKYHRRKRHGELAFPETCSPSQRPDISPAAKNARDAASSSSSLGSTTLSICTVGLSDKKLKKLEHRRKCGRPAHHRRRHGKEALHTQGSEESTTTLSSLDSVTDALQRLGLPPPPLQPPRLFGSQRGRRKQAA
ncbi:hypothetical protein LX32DRAFT_717519 [Colletotrichum zoysiae]|uniref:Fungal N-terminal domain-containing protein n=1 Tax=Colletotrichum zoysiae TaxID=1216348 RepID=A0AAD9HJ23_9PEZI|nr:hypothetical protein LX32DRAFT_717519 [Colletotrichum zoysiae]